MSSTTTSSSSSSGINDQDDTGTLLPPTSINPSTPDQLVYINAITNVENVENEENGTIKTRAEKNYELIDKYRLDPGITLKTPLYGYFKQTSSQIDAVDMMFRIFTEELQVMGTSTTNEQGEETETLAYTEIQNNGSNTIYNFTIGYNVETGDIKIGYQQADLNLRIANFNSLVTEHMKEAIKNEHLLSAMASLILENIYLYGLDEIMHISGGLQGTFMMYYNRIFGTEGFHKDSMGNTSFVILNYTNEDILPSAMVALKKTPHLGGDVIKPRDLMQSIIDDLELSDCYGPQIIKRFDMKPYGSFGFYDSLFVHSSPYDITIHTDFSKYGLTFSSGQNIIPNNDDIRISDKNFNLFPPLSDYKNINTPRNFTRMMINTLPAELRNIDIEGFNVIHILKDNVDIIVQAAKVKNEAAKKCIPPEDLCPLFTNPNFNINNKTCTSTLGGSNKKKGANNKITKRKRILNKATKRKGKGRGKGKYNKMTKKKGKVGGRRSRSRRQL